LGDIDELAGQIADLGLLHPIVVRPNGELIAGQRRLEAVKMLGWKDVPVHVVDIESLVRGEFSENAHRKDFTPSELVAIAASIEKEETERARARMTLGTAVPRVSLTGKTVDVIAERLRLGISGKTLERARAVVQAAEADPKRFGHLVAEMDRTGKVSAAYRTLRCAEDEKRILGLKPIVGRHRTLVIDPPWRYAIDFLGRSRPDYATMTKEELLALAVADWAEERCHLYLWTTNAMLRHAFDLMEAWGFRYNTILTWTKPRAGMGTHFRGATEHVLFGIRGVLATRTLKIPTWFEAPVGKHSDKPERFYDIVRAASYPPYGEAFQRKARPDFVNLFQQTLAVAP
jgi:ParB/RepB/Spo0J family partition protein